MKRRHSQSSQWSPSGGIKAMGGEWKRSSRERIKKIERKNKEREEGGEVCSDELNLNHKKLLWGADH